MSAFNIANSIGCNIASSIGCISIVLLSLPAVLSLFIAWESQTMQEMVTEKCSTEHWKCWSSIEILEISNQTTVTLSYNLVSCYNHNNLQAYYNWNYRQYLADLRKRLKIIHNAYWTNEILMVMSINFNIEPFWEAEQSTAD